MINKEEHAFPHELAAAIDGGPKELDGYLELRECSDIIRDIKALTNYKTPVAVELRDYFAAASLPTVVHDWCEPNPNYADYVAHRCYQFADAMLRERERKPE